VPGGSAAGVLGAVTRLESTAVIYGNNLGLSGAVSQDKFALAPHVKGARRSQGQKSASWPAVSALGAARLARDYFPPA
jgi:hypothetical protein